MSLISRLPHRMRGEIRSRIPKAIQRCVVKEPVVALTFDDGPSDATVDLLEILSVHEAKATFFMVGKNAESRPEIVAEVIKRGHAIGNHTQSHPSLTTLSFWQQIREIQLGNKSIPPTRIFRPPFGAQNVVSFLATCLMGLRPIVWSRSADDWHGEDANSLYERISTDLQPGEIILLHDFLESYGHYSAVSRKPTMDAVDTLLRRHSGDFKFVTVPDLLDRGDPIWREWFETHD